MKYIISLKTLARKLKKAGAKASLDVWASPDVIEWMRRNWMETMIEAGAKVSFKFEVVPIRLNHLGLVPPITEDKKPTQSWINAPFELVRVYTTEETEAGSTTTYKGYVIKRPGKQAEPEPEVPTQSNG